MDRFRPLAVSEQETLRAALRRIRGRRGARALVTPLGLVATVGASALALPSLGGHVAIAGALLGVGALAALALRRRRPGPHDDALARSLAADLAAGEARESRHEITAALVAEREGETATAFLRLAGGGVLFLDGGYLARAEDEGRFPRAGVVVVRAPRAGLVLAVEFDGAPIPPRPGGRLRREVIAEGRLPADGDVLATAWEDVPGTYLLAAQPPAVEDSIDGPPSAPGSLAAPRR